MRLLVRPKLDIALLPEAGVGRLWAPGPAAFEIKVDAKTVFDRSFHVPFPQVKTENLGRYFVLS